MRIYNMITGILAVMALAAYGKGYFLFVRGEGEECVFYTLLCAAALVWLVRRLVNGRYLRMSMRKVDRLNGRAFEKYLCAQFRHLGYRVTLTDYSHDYGADLILRRRGEKIVVQAKRYERNVGIAAVQEAVGSVAYYDADRAMVVTNRQGRTMWSCGEDMISRKSLKSGTERRYAKSTIRESALKVADGSRKLLQIYF